MNPQNETGPLLPEVVYRQISLRELAIGQAVPSYLVIEKIPIGLVDYKLPIIEHRSVRAMTCGQCVSERIDYMLFQRVLVYDETGNVVRAWKRVS